MFNDKENEILELFYNFDDIINQIGKKNEDVSEDMVIIWKLLYNRCKTKLIKPIRYNFTNNSKNPSIIITFTTCKRLNLFKETIYSLLNQWLDISKIDFWFCVDDNSSEEDRREMTFLFPWIQFYMKTSEEKGHRESMNIIWNKLNELKPIYWIHMEDDFLFFKAKNYVENAINGLNILQSFGNYKQILFNRNYGEGIGCYNILGHEVINNNEDYVVHNYSTQINPPYKNCNYWPHYSLLPSLIDVNSILEIGNYNSPNTFFEKDYAQKWADKGFKTAFFNSTNCQHIGKLRCERTDPTKKNSYQLNDVHQF